MGKSSGSTGGASPNGKAKKAGSNGKAKKGGGDPETNVDDARAEAEQLQHGLEIGAGAADSGSGGISHTVLRERLDAEKALRLAADAKRTAVEAKLKELEETIAENNATSQEGGGSPASASVRFFK